MQLTTATTTVTLRLKGVVADKQISITNSRGRVQTARLGASRRWNLPNVELIKGIRKPEGRNGIGASIRAMGLGARPLYHWSGMVAGFARTMASGSPGDAMGNRVLRHGSD